MKLRRNKIQPLPSTAPQAESIPLKPLTTSLSTFHRSCKTLPLFAFVEAYCNNDLSLLILSGTPTEEELATAWQEIIFEYSSLIKSENSDYLFELEKKIALSGHHIFYVDNATMFLRFQHSLEIVNELRNLGYDLPDMPQENDLNKVVSIAKTIVFDLAEMRDEYERLTNTVNGKKQTEDDFYKTIAALSKYQGYRMEPKSTTMTEFCAVFNLFISENKKAA